MAEKTTVAGAQAAVAFPVVVPSGPVASRANLTQVWVSTQEGQVALVFDNGKVDILLHREAYQTDLRYFRAFVAQKDKNRVTDAIGRVDGRPALIITPNTDALTHSNPAAVEFNRDGIHVSIFSNTFGTQTLLAIARSMQ